MTSDGGPIVFTLEMFLGYVFIFLATTPTPQILCIHLLPGISMLLDRPMAGPLLGSMRYRGLPPNHEATSGRLWYVCVYLCIR